MVGPNDVEVMRESLRYLKEDEIALSWAGDGSSYPFSYFQVPSTAGQTLDKSGAINPELTAIYSNIANLCASSFAWGEVVWTESEVRRLRGLKIVGAGEKIIVTVPDIESCT